jgi:uncharacterized protein (DUF983 family)
MDVGDTKQCSRCGDIKIKDKFIKNRNICKVCDNKRNRDNNTPYNIFILFI